jgi:hypothetical protein
VKKTNRILLFVLICALLCTCFAISLSASEAADGGLGEAIGGAVNDAVGDAVNDAVNGALDQIEKLPDVSTILDIHSIEDANAFLSTFEPAMLFIMAACGIVLAFFGFRLLKLALALIGFAGGWTIGSFLYDFVVNMGVFKDPIPAYVPFIVYAVSGIIFALIAYKLLNFGIFLGAAAGTFLFLSGLSIFNDLVDSIVSAEGEIKYLLARLVVALIVGLLAIVFTKLILILTTSAVGGMVGGVSLMVAIGQTANPTVEAIVGLALAIIGVIIQFRTGRKKKKD